jgi:hypothetical protein
LLYIRLYIRLDKISLTRKTNTTKLDAIAALDGETIVSSQIDIYGADYSSFDNA